MQTNTTDSSTDTNRQSISIAAKSVCWNLADLISADGHRIVVAFSATLQILSEPAEQKLFAETFLSTNAAVTIDHIAAYFDPHLRAAAEQFIGNRSVRDALTEGRQSELVAHLKNAAKSTAFACGIEVLAPFQLHVTSPTLERERLEQMQRTVAERQATNQAEHFARATDLLRQWETLHQSAPGITPGTLLQRLSPTDRGEMLRTLIIASANQAKQPDLWAVAGSVLLRVKLNDNSPTTTSTSLPTTLGPLRSVNFVDNLLLVGARGGVFLLRLDRLNDPRLYIDSSQTSEHGFSRAIIVEDTIVACHREAGLVVWHRDRPETPANRIAPAQLNGSPKYLQKRMTRETAIFAVENKLCELSPSGSFNVLLTLPAAIAGIEQTNELTIIATTDGRVTIYRNADFSLSSESRPAARISNIALMPWLSSARLLLTTGDGPVLCAGIDDQLITQFNSAILGMQVVKGSTGKVAAMSPDRQRIVFWNAWDERKPSDEIYVTGLTKHRVADITFA